jgi:hypothetical protein
MRATRLATGALGVVAAVWGVWLLHDDGFDRLRSATLWLAGGIVLHDFVLAPLVVVVGVLAARVLPKHHRPVAAVAFLVWGTITVAVANVLSGLGGKPGMDSLLHRPYLTSWLVLTALVWGGAVVVGLIRARRRRTAEA